MPFHPGAPAMAAKPMQPSPLMNVFHGIAAHQMAPPMGHPLAMQAPGAPMPLAPSGRPPAPAGHMPTMMPR